MSYICPRCHYKTDKKMNLKIHLMKKYICPKIYSDISVYEILENFDPVDEKQIKNFTCNYCDRSYTKKSNMKLHEKSCPVKAITSDEIKILYDTLDIMRKHEAKLLKSKNENNN